MSSGAQKRAKARRARDAPYATNASRSATAAPSAIGEKGKPMHLDSDSKHAPVTTSPSSSPSVVDIKSPAAPTPPASAESKFPAPSNLKPLPPTVSDSKLRSRDVVYQDSIQAVNEEKKKSLEIATKAIEQQKTNWLQVPLSTAKAEQFIIDHFGAWGTSNKDDVSHQHFKETTTAFGEIYADGVEKVLGNQRMRAGDASCTKIVDLGCGHAKILLQALLQFPNVTQLVGVELMAGRVQAMLKAFKSMVNFNPAQFSLTADEKHHSFTLSFRDTPYSVTPRTIEIREGNLFDAKDAYSTAQIVIFEVMISYGNACTCGKHEGEVAHPQTIEMLHNMPVGSRILTYEPFSKFATNAENDTVAVLHKACNSNIESRWKWISREPEIRATFSSNFAFQMLEKLS
jgi:hypothetical protein